MTTPENILIVLCNCPDENVANQLATGLVTARLAACVNQFAPVQSTYRWNERIEITQEVPLLIKTTQAAYPALEAWLQTNHPYEVAEIIALSPAAGLPAYLNWLDKEVQA
ncbi:divalent-cation tolerance protein CutA [Iodobacter ciconiae]|uniref:Divalent-cation tolerance protein CutA n=1 Tax=Iodobacter ciconiae TaxID=2496266 RepID=A0A3S8ZTQ6_9NEIS|nr:divalent-cation tolerance protein CutA [Iodobacter ciconiae]AZN36890.1 divalent-cation tolerance protein CutA [Iodobacter ciconiae]